MEELKNEICDKYNEVKSAICSPHYINYDFISKSLIE